MGKFTNDEYKMREAQEDFEKNFGVSEYTRSYISEYTHESVIVVENHVKRAYYSFSIELLKVINLNGN